MIIKLLGFRQSSSSASFYLLQKVPSGDLFAIGLRLNIFIFTWYNISFLLLWSKYLCLIFLSFLIFLISSLGCLHWGIKKSTRFSTKHGRWATLIIFQKEQKTKKNAYLKVRDESSVSPFACNTAWRNLLLSVKAAAWKIQAHLTLMPCLRLTSLQKPKRRQKSVARFLD